MKKFTAITAAFYSPSRSAPAPRPPEKPRKFVPTEPVMPLSQVKPGMKGYAKTVLSGVKITPF